MRLQWKLGLIKNCKNYIEYICSVEKYMVPEKKDRIACEIATCSLLMYLYQREIDFAAEISLELDINVWKNTY